MRLRTIQSAEPLPASRVRLVWDDGAESIVDLTPVLAKGGVFEYLADPTAFNTVEIGARRRTLVWQDPGGDEIDLCADALWRLAHEGAIDAACPAAHSLGFPAFLAAFEAMVNQCWIFGGG